MFKRLLQRLRPGVNDALAVTAAPPPRPKPMALAAIDFAEACHLLDYNETIVAGGLSQTDEQHRQLFTSLAKKWRGAPINKTIPFANDSITIQLSEMFQHVHDLDSGDAGAVALDRLHRGDHARGNSEKTLVPAAFTPSIGPSTHTNPSPTLALQMKARYADESADADIETRHLLTQRVGFSLWLGPSQAPTPTHKAGVYLKGHVPSGTVVGLFPGAAYNADMRYRASDGGGLANPRVPRLLVPRFDECVLDVHAPEARAAAARNPYALAHHIRQAPPAITPNVMRLQFDFVAAGQGGGAARLSSLLRAQRGEAERLAAAADVDAVMPFPAHLREYVPNIWGADVSVGQELYGMLEQNIWAKGVVVIALRPLWDEELFFPDYALRAETGMYGPTARPAHEAAVEAGDGDGGGKQTPQLLAPPPR